MADFKRPLMNEALKLVRLYWGYSQVELAEKLSLSQSMISDIERGSKPASFEILERYSSQLGIRLSQLVFFAEELEGNALPKRGRLLIANNVLHILQALAPKEASDGVS